MAGHIVRMSSVAFVRLLGICHRRVQTVTLHLRGNCRSRRHARPAQHDVLRHT